MNRHMAIPVALAAIVLAGYAGLRNAHTQTEIGSGANIGGTVEQKFALTAAQRSAIYQAVAKDKSKETPTQFPAVVGADVPPMIELYELPDDAVTDNPTAKFFKYTVLQEKVVVVDPTKMRVVDIIGPTPKP